MSEETLLDPRAQGEAFLASWDEIVAERRMLRIEHDAMAKQIDAMADEIERLRGREQSLKTQLDAALASDDASINLLEKIGQELLAGLRVIRPKTALRTVSLRGVPQRSNDTTDPLPRVVQMGPKTA